MTVWLELRGPNTRGLPPKAAVAPGWTDPAYRGILWSEESDAWIGMRLDNHICVDCDCYEAADAWLKYIDQHELHTWVRKTPNGWHFIYKRTPDTYGLGTGTALLKGIHPKIDFKVGNGHQIVYRAPGYEDLVSDIEPIPFNPAWVPAGAESNRPVVDDWSEMPEGIGDNAMISFAGTFRRWGMDEGTIKECLIRIADTTMIEHPMPLRSIARIARSAMRWDPDEPQQVMCPKCGNDIEVR